MVMLLTLGIAVGCTKHAKQAVDLYPDAPWVEDETQAVPIMFGNSRYNVTQTKAEITNDNLSDVKFGILGLDTEAYTGETKEEGALLLLNRYGVITSDEKLGTTIKFMEATGDVRYYYPVYSLYNYSFYGYHTTAANDGDVPALTIEGGNFLVKDIEIGEADILWAKAEAEPFSSADGGPWDGYNARYIRNARKQGDEFYKEHLPELVFEHKTAALHFNVKAEDADAEESFKEEHDGGLLLTDIALKGAYCTADLNLTEGTLTGTGEPGKVTFSDETESIRPTTTPQQFGTGLFIVPGVSELELEFTLSEPNKREEHVFISLSPMPEGGFKEGVSYTFTISIKSLEQIFIRASVNEWQENEEKIDDIVIE